MNWPAEDQGNILYNDKKFVCLLYEWNGDQFTELTNVVDVAEDTKDNIYRFIEDSEKTVFMVDCENSDPYSLCAALKQLDPDRFRDTFYDYDEVVSDKLAEEYADDWGIDADDVRELVYAGIDLEEFDNSDDDTKLQMILEADLDGFGDMEINGVPMEDLVDNEIDPVKFNNATPEEQLQMILDKDLDPEDYDRFSGLKYYQAKE